MPKLRRIDLTKSFRVIDTSFFKEGDEIGFECYVQRFHGFAVIIPAGTILTQKYLKLLANSDRHYVQYTEYEKYLEVVPETLKSSSDAQKQIEPDSKTDIIDNDDIADEKLGVLYNGLIGEMQKYFEENKEIDQKYVDELLYQYILLFKKDASVFRIIMNTMSKDDRHAVHSVNVALLSLALGNYFNYTLSQMKYLGIAAILHDLGKKEIQNSIYYKSTPLEPHEVETIKMHTSYSYHTALSMGVTNRAILDAIQHHHELLDGSGYPDGLRGQRITDFTQIITISDVFDGMTSKRSYRNNKSALVTLKTIKTEYKDKIRVKCIDGFIKLFQNAYAS